MKVFRFVCLASSLGVLTSLPVGAHHSFAAEYDAAKPVDLNGTVTKVEWMNPHAHFYVDVKGPDGKLVNWNMELASPNMLTRNGWKRNSLKEGDVIHVTGSRAKDGTPTASVVNIELPDGRRLTFMSAIDGGPSK